MPVPQKNTQPSNKYLPAVLKENASGWIVEYYALHPQCLILQRKQIRIKRIKQRYRSIREARLHALEMCETINQKLRGGWSPFFVGEDARLYEKLTTVLEIFIAESKKEKRENTMRSYQSFAKMLKEWTAENCKDIYVSLFNRPLAVRYLDYRYNELGVSATTYNNQLKMANAFFNWAREKCYCK